MAFSLKDLQARAATVEVEFYGETAEITYDPTMFTAQFRVEYARAVQEMADAITAKRKEAAQKKEQFDPTLSFETDARLMLMVVKDWNIMLDGEAGEKLPLTVEAVIEHLPNLMVNLIANAIWDDVGNLGKKTSSAATSSSKS